MVVAVATIMMTSLSPLCHPFPIIIVLPSRFPDAAASTMTARRKKARKWWDDDRHVSARVRLVRTHDEICGHWGASDIVTHLLLWPVHHPVRQIAHPVRLVYPHRRVQRRLRDTKRRKGRQDARGKAMA